MRDFIRVFIIFLGIQGAWAQAQQPDLVSQLKQMTPADYQPATVILKVKETHRSLCAPDAIGVKGFARLADEFGVYELNTKFPFSPRPDRDRDKAGRQLTDISLIYELKYSGIQPLEQVIRAFQDLDAFEYVEPKLNQELCYIPNDPDINQQWHLILVRAFQAWDIERGDSNIAVGIIDTGIDLDHLDLKDNLVKNYADPINGIDDDNDGYLDNFHGYDLAGNTPNPQATDNDHGVHVSGCAVATNDNNIGGAGVGWNTRILPIKAGSGNSISAGYEGIVYAADHGAQFINCSWGSYFYSRFSEDIVNYATVNQGALVFGGAGNRGTEDTFYPASYRYVFSVGATTITDSRAGFSNYGYELDVFAPGNDIWATLDSSKYGLNQGTSMSSPMAAGCAALVMAHYPGMTPEQAGEQLRVTCDNIDAIGPNVAFATKLARGRINLLTALSGINSPSVRMTHRTVTDKSDDVFAIGDTLYISGDFLNYLNPVSNLSAFLTTTSPDVQIIDGSSNLGAIGTLASTDNHADPFKVVISPTVGVNEQILFRVRLSEGTYVDDIYFYVKVNLDYLNISANRISTTMTGNGRIGYVDPEQVNGLGFLLDSSRTRLYEAGLMIGQEDNGQFKVVDAITGEPNQTDDDFQVVTPPFNVPGNPNSDFDGFGVFTDNNAGAEQLGLEITQRSFAWTDPGHEGYVVFEYTLNNTSLDTLRNLHAGIYADWDVIIASRNQARYDPSRLLGYCYYSELPDGPLFGTQLLTDEPFYAYSMDLVGGGSGGIDIFDVGGYSSEDKYVSMSTNRTGAGLLSAVGNDVAQVISTGGIDIDPGDSVVVAFALHGADDQDELFLSAEAAYERYNGTPVVSVPELQESQLMIWPNPATQTVNILPGSATGSLQAVSLVSLHGQQLRPEFVRQGDQLILDVSNVAPGWYLVQVNGEDGTATARLIVTP